MGSSVIPMPVDPVATYLQKYGGPTTPTTRSDLAAMKDHGPGVPLKEDLKGMRSQQLPTASNPVDAYLQKYGKGKDTSDGGITDVIAHGLGGGPINALVDAISNPSSYHGHFWENLKTSQQQFNSKVDNYNTRHPNIGAAAGTAASAVPVAATLLASGGLSAPEALASGAADAVPLGIGKRMLGGAATGALAQGAGTALNTPGTPLDRLKGVAKAGFPLAGAAVGAAIPAAGGLLAGLADYLPGGTPGATKATGTFLDRLRHAGMVPEDLSAAAQQAPADAPIVAADLMGRPGQKLVRWTTDQPSLGGAQLEKQLSDRNLGQLDRTLSNMKGAMGQDFKNIPATMEQLKADMLTRAKPLYDAATPQPLSPNLVAEVNQLRADFPEYDKAFANGDRLRKGEAALQAQADRASGKAPAPAGPKASALRAQFKDDPKLADAFIQKLGLKDDGPPSGMTVGDVHYAKLGLDDQINSYANKGGVAPNRAIQLQRSLSTLLDQMEQEHPTYGVARSQYRGDKEIQAAMDLGKKALHLPVDELQIATQGFTPGEQQAFQASAMDQLKQAASNVDARRDLMARWLNSPNMEARLKLIAPSDEAAQSMLANRDVERTMALTGNAPRAGSNTSTNMADQPGNMLVSGSTMGRAFINPRRALSSAAGSIGETVHKGLQTRLSDNLAPMLGADRGELPALIARLKADQQAAIARALAERVVGGVAGYREGTAQRVP